MSMSVSARFDLPSSRWSTLRETLFTVDRATLRWLERDFIFFPTVIAGNLVHLSGATIGSTASFSIRQYSHSYSVSYAQNT